VAYLVDTNLLVRLAQPHHPLNAIARLALDALRDRGEDMCITSQNLIEFWGVATRPVDSLNGLGITPEKADQELTQLEGFFRLLPDVSSIYPNWRRLVVGARVSGRQVHDARLVAVMLAHDISHLLTFNTSDFKRYRGVTVIHPQEVVSL
jgi:predicted nucleic acid-binding protein